MSNPAIYDSRERDGISTIRGLAVTMCRIVNTFGPIIELKYRANPAIQEALTWARTACTLVPDLDAVLIEPNDASTAPSNPASIPGSYDQAPLPPTTPPIA
jgi:hypothetical protein